MFDNEWASVTIFFFSWMNTWSNDHPGERDKEREEERECVRVCVCVCEGDMVILNLKFRNISQKGYLKAFYLRRNLFKVESWTFGEIVPQQMGSKWNKLTNNMGLCVLEKHFILLNYLIFQ